jgi:hypothetical protein
MVISRKLFKRSYGPYVITRKRAADYYFVGDIDTKSEKAITLKQPIHISKLLEFHMPVQSVPFSTATTPKRISVWIPDQGDNYQWYDGTIIKPGAYSQALIKWDNGDADEWVNLADYSYRWI